MADYAKKKNDELAALCKERGLAHTGKKADLVKRLEEHDAKSATTAAPAKPAAKEDEIDWDDEPATETAKSATTKAAANAIAAGGIGEVSNPQAVPNQEAAIDPAKTDDLSVDPPADEPVAAPGKDFSTGLAERTLDEEIEKRKARLERFGVPKDDEQWKNLERAKRFGNTALLGGINTALPTKDESKKRGRGAEDKDGGIRKRSKARPGPPSRNGSEKPKQGEKKQGGYASWMSADDIAKAEARKAKFATA